MTTEQQALTLLSIANTLNSQLAEENLLQDTYGVSNSLSFHVGDKVFAALTKLSKLEPITSYQHVSLHAILKVGYVEFAVCHNLL